MRIKITPAQCIASGACRLAAPRLFSSDEDGMVTLLNAEPPPELQAAARKAAEACPAAVITIKEDE